MSRRVSVSVLVLATACRLGGPEGSPTELLELEGSVPPEEPEAGVEGMDDDPPAAPPAEPAPPDPPDAAAPPAPPAAGCKAPAGLECDPVSGEGCLPLMQCLADPASSTPAAYCVFGGIQLDVTCTQDELGTDCPPQFTCVKGECRKYCYCDTDCDDGAACTDARDGAFKLCDLAPL